jgi:hypothetical protein
VNCVTSEILIYLSLHIVITTLLILYIDLDSNEKRQLSHMRIITASNNCNSSADVDADTDADT